MTASKRFQVVPFTNPSGAIVYRVTGRKVNGERVRSNYQTEAEALGEKQRLELEAANVDAGTLLRSTRLTSNQLADAEAALKELPAERSLVEAVRWYLRNYREPQKRRTVADAFVEFLDAKRAENCRPRTLGNLRVRVGALKAALGEKLVSDVLPDHVRDLIYRPGRSPVSVANDRRALSSFFTWASSRDYCSENPIGKVAVPQQDQGEPEILSVDETRRLLAVAGTHKGGKLVPYAVLATFAAIRPAELARLTWRDVDLEAGTVTISGKAAKLRQRRVVELSENAVAWLLPFATRKPPIMPKNWRRDFDVLKAAIGYGRPEMEARLNKDRPDGQRPKLKPWPEDVLRHTGISMHFAAHEHEGKTAAWAGNSPTMIHRHYKGLVRKSDAEEFWQIRPEPAGKIIKLAAAAS